MITQNMPINRVERSDNNISLVFNCAWGADDIDAILGLLKKERIKASFFFVGKWAEKYPEKVKTIANEGHDLGNHSYSHPRMTTQTLEDIINDISKCSETIKKITGRTIAYFSAPFADYNNNVFNAAGKLGLKVIQNDVDSGDWRNDISGEKTIENIFSNVKSGSIVLLHCGAKHTANVLAEIIGGLKTRGFHIVPVSALLYSENYTLDAAGTQISTKTIRTYAKS